MLNNIQIKSFIVLILLFGLPISFSSCGKKGDPRPPDLAMPRSAEFFKAQARADGVMLNWQSPTVYAMADASGRAAPGSLDGFEVMRSRFKRGESAGWETLATIKIIFDPQLGEQKNYSYFDKDVEQGKIYDYRIVPFNLDGLRARSGNILRVSFLGKASIIEVAN